MNPIASLVFAIVSVTVAIVSAIYLIRKRLRKAHAQEQEKVKEN